MAKLYAYGEAKPLAREQLWHEITGFLEASKMNRPQFSRHSTAAFRTALHTLPAIAGY